MSDRSEWDDFSSNRHPPLTFSWSMIFFRKPVPTFRDHALGDGDSATLAVPQRGVGHTRVRREMFCQSVDSFLRAFSFAFAGRFRRSPGIREKVSFLLPTRLPKNRNMPPAKIMPM